MQRNHVMTKWMTKTTRPMPSGGSNNNHSGSDSSRGRSVSFHLELRPVVKVHANGPEGTDEDQTSERELTPTLRLQLPHRLQYGSFDKALELDADCRDKRTSPMPMRPVLHQTSKAKLSLRNRRRRRDRTRSESYACNSRSSESAPTPSEHGTGQQDRPLGRTKSALQLMTQLRAKVQTNSPAQVLPENPTKRHHRLVLLPSSPFWAVWNSLHLLALAYVSTIVPYHIALPSDQFTRWSYPLNRCIDVFYAVDILVNLRSAYVDPRTGDLVDDPKRIAVFYSRHWLLLDLAMALPLDLLLRDLNGHSSLTFMLRCMRLLRLAKLMRILQTQSLLDFCEDALGIGRNKLMVVKLLVSLALVAHLTACGFILAATFDSSQGGSWIVHNSLTHAPAVEIYVVALYWAFTMMTTVGFGDIVPITLIERVYSILAMVLSAGIYAYVIASMSAIVSLMNISHARYYDKINELNAYMANRGVPSELQVRTRKFVRYYLQKKTVFDEAALFDVLPSSLREELLAHYVKTVVQHLRFFQQVEPQFAADVALLLQPVFFAPQSLVVVMDTEASEMFIVSTGTLVVILTHAEGTAAGKKNQQLASIGHEQELPIATLHEGDHFGELALLCEHRQRRRMASVRAKSYCELHSLRYEHIQRAMKKYPLVRTKLVETAQLRWAVLKNLHDRGKLQILQTQCTSPAKVAMARHAAGGYDHDWATIV